MKICPKCGSESEFKFCMECGYDLTGVVEKTDKVIQTCSNCGIETETKFCPNCGCDLAANRIVNDSDGRINESAIEFTETEIESETVIDEAIEESSTITIDDTDTPILEAFDNDIENEPFITEDTKPEMNSEINPVIEEKVHQKTWFIILLLIFFFPVGVFFMWRHKKFNKIARIIASVLLGLNFVFWALIFIALIIPCDHEWEEATCESPKTCTICDETEGVALGHTEGDWVITEEATLVDVGVEEVLCVRCGKSLDSRGTECKKAKVDGNTFNFTDEELIDWIEDFTTAEIGSEDLELFDNGNTSYRINTTDGDVGALMLNHAHGTEISAIMVYFEEYETAAALAVLIGEEIDSDFNSEDALYKIAFDESYTAADMTVMMLDLDTDFEVAVLAPNDFFVEILD